MVQHAYVNLIDAGQVEDRKLPTTVVAPRRSLPSLDPGQSLTEPMSTFRPWLRNGFSCFSRPATIRPRRGSTHDEAAIFAVVIQIARAQTNEVAMHELIYLVGLVVVVMFILGRLGLR